MKKKILSLTIGPVLVLGLITIVLMLTMVKDSMIDEVQEALKGTAAATLAAYDQNTGDYIESSNGDIWKEAIIFPSRRVWLTGLRKTVEWMLPFSTETEES